MSRLAGSASIHAKRLVVGLFDVMATLIAALLLLPAFTEPAWAYVDPSVMTYTIQALAGVAVALSAVAGVAFRRSRKALFRALGVDEDAKKVKDSPLRRIDPSEDCITKSVSELLPASAISSNELGPFAKDKQETGKKLPDFSWPQRLLLSLLVSLFVVVTILIMPAFETLAGNESSLVFGLKEAWFPISVLATALVAIMTLLCSLMRGRVFRVVIALLLAVGLCCYLQAMVFNAGVLPTTDGRPIEWRDYRVIAVLTAFAWIVVIVLMVGLGQRFKRAMSVFAALTAGALLVVQGVAVSSLMANCFREQAETADGSTPASQYVMSDKGLYTVSPKNNVIVIVLDTFDTTDMMDVLQDEPEFSNRFSGFTWFKNSVGAMSPTRYGIPYLLTGTYPEVGEPLEDFVADRYRRSTFLNDIEQANYSIGIYTDTIADMALSSDEKKELIYDKTVNIKVPDSGHINQLNVPGTLKAMVICALYRDAPWFVKPFFYFTTDELNQHMVEETLSTGDGSHPYVMDDSAWYDGLKASGLSFEGDTNNNGAYRFIHLCGTHQPYVLAADGSRATHQTSLDEQARGSLRMVADYVDELKRLGVFENTTIIITADHGIWWESYPGPLPFLSSPLMLVKPSGETGVQPLKISDAEIIAHDVFPTIIQAIGGNVDNYGGSTIFEQNEIGRDRRYVMNYCVSGVDQILVEFKIVGDVLVWGNWEESGNTWDPANTPQP